MALSRTTLENSLSSFMDIKSPFYTSSPPDLLTFAQVFSEAIRLFSIELNLLHTLDPGEEFELLEQSENLKVNLYNDYRIRPDIGKAIEAIEEQLGIFIIEMSAKLLSLNNVETVTAPDVNVLDLEVILQNGNNVESSVIIKEISDIIFLWYRTGRIKIFGGRLTPWS